MGGTSDASSAAERNPSGHAQICASQPRMSPRMRVLPLVFRGLLLPCEVTPAPAPPSKHGVSPLGATNVLPVAPTSPVSRRKKRRRVRGPISGRWPARRARGDGHHRSTTRDRARGLRVVGTRSLWRGSRRHSDADDRRPRRRPAALARGEPHSPALRCRRDALRNGVRATWSARGHRRCRSRPLQPRRGDRVLRLRAVALPAASERSFPASESPGGSS